MKGWIEVTEEFYGGSKLVLINIEDISAIFSKQTTQSEFKDAKSTLYFRAVAGAYLHLKETYDELKQKISEATPQGGK